MSLAANNCQGKIILFGKENRNPTPSPISCIIKIATKLKAIHLEQILVMESKLSRKKKTNPSISNPRVFI